MPPEENAPPPKRDLTAPPDTGPYCAVCHYPLEGLTESSKCPECGNPIVQVLRWPDLPGPTTGKRWRSHATFRGRPLIEIASGPGPDGPTGKPRAFIAIGDDAVGFIAIGGLARGVVSLGGLSIGVFSFGGCSLGALASLGGASLGGGLAVGGGAVSPGVAVGGGAWGYVATLSGAGMGSRFGLPMPETPLTTAALAGVLLLAALLYALAVTLSRLRSAAGSTPETRPDRRRGP